MEISVRYLPIIVLCLFIVTMSIKLHITISTKNIDDISSLLYNTTDTSEVFPIGEMCFLGQAANFLWVLGSLVIYVKYRQVNDICNRYDMSKKKFLNKLTLQMGLISFLGLSILANFQEIYSIPIHWTGAFLFFGFGSFYQSFQTGLYFCITKIIGQRKVIPLRIVLSTISVISFALYFICAIMKRRWQQNIYGFDLHINSIIFEVIWTISTIVYLALFYWEFTKISLYEPDLFVIEKYTSSVNMQQTNEAFEE